MTLEGRQSVTHLLGRVSTRNAEIICACLTLRCWLPEQPRDSYAADELLWWGKRQGNPSHPTHYVWYARQDLNLQPRGPKPRALPDCATGICGVTVTRALDCHTHVYTTLATKLTTTRRLSVRHPHRIPYCVRVRQEGFWALSLQEYCGWWARTLVRWWVLPFQADLSCAASSRLPAVPRPLRMTGIRSSMVFMTLT